jgi:Beta-lactamase class C and other penicillin binding proteins
MARRSLRGIAAACALLALGATAAEEDARARFVGSLFTGVELYEEFARLEEIFPAHRIRASDAPWLLPEGAPLDLPETYRWQGEDRSTAALLDETRTSALLVLHEGRIRHEHYAFGGGPEVTWLSMSVGKSFVSALVGIAIEEGLIESVHDPITRYVPALAGSAYDGVEIEDVLQMSSGAR